MEIEDIIYNDTKKNKQFAHTWIEYLKKDFIRYPKDIPQIILILSLICTIGAFLNMQLKDFPIPLPVILFLFGCSFEILSFASSKVQEYVNTIQWMSPKLFFNLFTPIITFHVAFDMDIYMLQMLTWQIILMTIPGFLVNHTLILWYLNSVNKFSLRTMPTLLFSLILYSSDPMLTSAAIRDLGLSRSLTNLINGQSLISFVLSLVTFSIIMEMNRNMDKTMNYSLAYEIRVGLGLHFLASFVTGIISSKILQVWMATIFGDDVNHISLSFSILYLVFYICELIGMSGIFTLAIMGLFLNSTSFKPGVEALLLEFWNCLAFVSFLMVFTFIGLLIPAQTYAYISFSDLFFSLNMYFTLFVLRLLTILLLSPLLSRLGHGFNWRWAFIMVLSEMRGMPNISMALLLAYDSSTGTEREKSQMLFHGVAVCFITLILNRFILPLAVSKLGLRDVTSTKYKSLYYTYKHFQELTKSIASTLKFDKDLANADWNVVERAIIFQNPYAASQEETTGHQMVRCPNCNKEIDETLNIEAMELANSRLLSAQIASYQRQYRNETLSQNAVQLLVGAAGSFGEKKREYMSPETIKSYSESKKILTFIRKILLNWVYNTRKEKGTPSRNFLLRIIHSIVFTDEFEYAGYLVILMNLYPIVISWIPTFNEIYEAELRKSNFSFLVFYILEAVLKVAAMRKEYFLHTWNVFELAITFVGIIDASFYNQISKERNFTVIKTMVFLKIVRLLRLLRILKLVTPKLLQIIDKTMSQQLSFRYSVLKGYVQGEADIMTVMDHISSSQQIKQMLVKRVTRNTARAMKELGYLEYDHPEIAITMKTKEQIDVMLNIAREIVKVFRSEGIIHKIEGSEINKLIIAKKKEMFDFQPDIIRSPTIEEVLYQIPWLDKEQEHISFIQERAKLVTFDCGNDIFEEGDKPKGIYIIISGMVKLQKSKPSFSDDNIISGSKEKDFPKVHTDYLISGEIMGELNCLTNTLMEYSATCKTVVETCFISRKHLFEAFELCCPAIEYKMWLKIGLTITAKKVREKLSYEDWNYKMQLQLCNLYVKDVPLNTKTDIYDEAIIYIVLIHGAVEDSQLRKVYKAPSLIPITCHQIQGTEEFTKLVIVQTSIDLKKIKSNTRKYIPFCKHSLALQLSVEEMTAAPTQDNADQTSVEELCYTLINHEDHKPLVNTAEEHYENVSLQAERPRSALKKTETDAAPYHQDDEKELKYLLCEVMVQLLSERPVVGTPDYFHELKGLVNSPYTVRNCDDGKDANLARQGGKLTIHEQLVTAPLTGTMGTRGAGALCAVGSCPVHRRVFKAISGHVSQRPCLCGNRDHKKQACPEELREAERVTHMLPDPDRQQ
ncbi:PREDICTED: sodium/hydrogen exchanger 10 [Elephantulus edwardii]|uniref:sodium/hydrogen exchanger 10 n=1 Tax=Elephantulus edwardii TaxID=28737 RepID=UPI0003F06E35|nr:PREDICTED: sodium/hydrogen exchanger 10 [Elephantulus edwardii]